MRAGSRVPPQTKTPTARVGVIDQSKESGGVQPGESQRRPPPIIPPMPPIMPPIIPA